MIFECRARYLYLYAPFFVMLGVPGWVGLYRRVEMVARGCLLLPFLASEMIVPLEFAHLDR